jgi:hypothetical protein
MNDPGDEDLRRLFAELKERDRSLAPPFVAPIAERERRTRWPFAWPPMRAAAAVVVVVAGGLLAAGLLRRARPTGQVDISGWQSPTAFLVSGPGAAILDSVPSVSASVIDPLLTNTTNTRRGQ